MNSNLTYITDVVALKKLMIEQGINTKLALSEASGIDRNTVGKIVDGKEQPSASNMYRLVSALKMSPEKAGRIFFKPNLRNT